MVLGSTLGREDWGAGRADGCDVCGAGRADGFDVCGAGRVDGCVDGAEGRVDGFEGWTGFHLPPSLVSQPPGFPGCGRYTLPSGPA